MAEIHKTRQNQAATQQLRNSQTAQMGLAPQQMQARGTMNNPNQFNPAFGMPPAAQPGQNLGNPMQQQLSQNQRMMQNGNMPNVQQPMQNGQNGQMMPNGPRPAQLNRPQFTQEEQQQIQANIRNMMTGMSEQDKVNLHGKVANMPMATRQQMQAQNIDPLMFILRQQATNMVAAQRARRQQLAAQGMQNPGNAPMPSEGRPTPQMPMHGQPSLPVSAPHLPDSTFQANHLDQILGQQREDALRHQAAGQDVVPASNIQGVPPQMRGTPQQPQPGQPGATRPMQNTAAFQSQHPGQTPWNGQQNTQQNMPYAPQNPRQPATPNFASLQNQASQPPALQGQLGGLGNNRAQRTSQQGHSMPTLNQPVDLPNQIKNNNMQKTPAQTPQPTAKLGPNHQSGNGNNSNVNSRQQNVPNPAMLRAQIAKLPAKIQEQLARLPHDGARMQWMLEAQKKAQQQKLQTEAGGQGTGMSQTISQQSLQNQNQNQGSRANQMNTTQVIPPTFSAVSQPSMNSSGLVSTANSQGLQPQPYGNANGPPPPRLMPIPLSEEQILQMDGLAFPRNIINFNQLAQMPDHVKHWRQLKEYVQMNMPQMMKSIMDLQSIHFQNLRNTTNVRKMQAQQQQQQQQQLAQNTPQFGQTGAAPQATMIPQANQPLPQNDVNSNMLQVPNFPPPSNAEMQNARQSLPPHMTNVSDDQLRELINQRRRRNFAASMGMQQAQRNNMMQAHQQQQLAQGSTGQAPPAQMQQPVRGSSQTLQASQQQMQTQQTPNQPPKTPAQQAKQGQRAVGPGSSESMQNNQKGARKTTTDDVVEVPDPNTANQMVQPPTRQSQTNPTKGVPNITPEDYNKLSPEQKAAYQARMKQFSNALRANQMAMNNQSAPGRPSVAHDLEARFKRLKEEVEQSMPTRPVIQVDPTTRNQLIEKLRELPLWIKKLDEALPRFFYQTKDERRTKDVYRSVS